MLLFDIYLEKRFLFLRMDNITLGYTDRPTYPASKNSIRLAAYVLPGRIQQTNYSGLDPEAFLMELINTTHPS
jgi:hypothetical protein